MSKPYIITCKTSFTPKELRQKLGLKRTGFANVIGASVRAIESWEQGTRTPTKMVRNFMIVLWNHPELVDIIQERLAEFKAGE